MLPLVPVSIGLTLLIAAFLLASSPDAQRQGIAILADDMLRHHNAMLVAAVRESPDPPLDLDEIEQSLHLGPFRPLMDWDSDVAEQVIEVNEGENVVERWLLTWPSSFRVNSSFNQDSVAAIPYRLHASGYRNSAFGIWSNSEQMSILPQEPTGGIQGLSFTGVLIPDGAPVLANKIE
jgi:hypothetical protein